MEVDRSDSELRSTISEVTHPSKGCFHVNFANSRHGHQGPCRDKFIWNMGNALGLQMPQSQILNSIQTDQYSLTVPSGSTTPTSGMHANSFMTYTLEPKHSSTFAIHMSSVAFVFKYSGKTAQNYSNEYSVILNVGFDSKTVQMSQTLIGTINVVSSSSGSVAIPAFSISVRVGRPITITLSHYMEGLSLGYDSNGITTLSWPNGIPMTITEYYIE